MYSGRDERFHYRVWCSHCKSGLSYHTLSVLQRPRTSPCAFIECPFYYLALLALKTKELLCGLSMILDKGSYSGMQKVGCMGQAWFSAIPILSVSARFTRASANEPLSHPVSKKLTTYCNLHCTCTLNLQCPPAADWCLTGSYDYGITFYGS